MSARSCTIEELEKVLTGPSNCLLIDVREDVEYHAERIPGFQSQPLSRLSREIPRLPEGRPIYVVCRSGSRARQAADILERSGRHDVRVLEGGIRAWIASGRDVERRPSGVWSLERQVRLAAGALILTGAALSFVLHPAWIGLCVFVAAGLVFSAVTDTCGMALLLARMPWNRV